LYGDEPIPKLFHVGARKAFAAVEAVMFSKQIGGPATGKQPPTA
jgi:hypothetical protein